jgi:hypothetical protein
LLNNEVNGLLELDSTDFAAKPSFQGWLTSYTKGLLLLKSNRYPDASVELVNSHLDLSTSSDEKDAFRLAAALSLLATKDLRRATEYLGRSLTSGNSYIIYIESVLKLHLAVAENDTKSIKSLEQKLYENRKSNVILWRAVKAIKRKDFDLAIKLETDAFLCLSWVA